MAISDLGGLGTREGTPTPYDWTAPNILPALVPWFAILLLLLLPANRTGTAWLVWLPLILIVALTWSVLSLVLSFVPSTVLDWFLQIVSAQAFGVTGLWLLANHFGRRHRFLSFLGMLATLAVLSAFSWLVRQDLSDGFAEIAQMAILLGLSVLAVSAALSLTGLCCRRQYRPVALTVWLAVWLLAVWLAIILPFALVAAAGSGSGWEILSAMLLTAAVAAAVCFATLLPFLTLSFTSPFYRERLKDLLNLGQEAPPIIPVVPAGSPA